MRKTDKLPSAPTIVAGAAAQLVADKGTSILPADEANHFAEIGANWAKAQASRLSIAEDLTAHLRTVGAESSFPIWELCRKAFATAWPSSDEAGRKAWRQIIELAQDQCGLGDKPKAQTDEAQRKASARALPEGTPEQLRAQAAAMVKSGDLAKVKEAAKLVDAADRKVKKAQRDASAKAHAATAPTIERIRAALKRLDGNAKALAEVLALCLKLSPEPAPTPAAATADIAATVAKATKPAKARTGKGTPATV